jgi:hypothetical protein
MKHLHPQLLFPMRFMSLFVFMQISALSFKVIGGTAPRRSGEININMNNSMVWIPEWTIPTERPPLVGEVFANFLQIEGATWSAWRIPTAVFSIFYPGAATFLSSSSSVVLTRLSGTRSRPTTFFSGSAGNRTWASGSVAKNSNH